jgi:D-serine deaminase-like pyridoxal phosphate-dependent protein
VTVALSAPATRPATPYLRVDLVRLRGNILRVAEHAATRGVALRPHVKTHKSMDIARLQLATGAVGITVATLGEAETFVRLGVQDVFVAYPLWLEESTAARLRDLTGDARIAIGVDSAAGAARAGRLLGGTAVEVLVEVDSGHHRTGAAPEEAGTVGQAARRSGLTVRGVFTFPGHSYAPEATRSAAADEAAALATAAASMRATGMEPGVVSGGSTPSLEHTDTDVVTELRPGVYVFGDAQQWELGTTTPERIALACRATVISHTGGRLVLDAGSKVLGADRAAYATGFGRLPAYPDARVVLLSEHHAVVDLAGAPLPELGSRVDVVPNHVCAAVNLVDDLYVEEAGQLRPWPVTARGLNS